MKFKDLLEKMEDNEEVCADLMVHTISSHSFRHRVFIAWASDFLTNKVWLDKDVKHIQHEQLDDYTCGIRVVLSE